MAQCRIEQADALDFLRSLEADSVDVVLTDPPYFKVKGEPWDHAWDDLDAFMFWLGDVVRECSRVLRPNGSLFLFCSPKRAARTELLIGEHMSVLNHLIWAKPASRSLAYRADRSRLRSFFDDSERIIFAEPFGSDSAALGEAGYAIACDRARGFVFEPLRAYLAGEKKRSGLTGRQVQEGMFQRTGKRYVLERHAFSRSQWELPTEEQYEAFRDLLNSEGAEPKGVYLKREYEDLKREYEDLRRPFDVAGED